MKDGNNKSPVEASDESNEQGSRGVGLHGSSGQALGEIRGQSNERFAGPVSVPDGYRRVPWRQLPEGDTVFYFKRGKLRSSTVAGFGRFERELDGEDPMILLEDGTKRRCSEIFWR